MPLSSHLAPGFVRLRYTGTLRPHTQIIPIKFSGTPVPGTEPEFETADGTVIGMEAAINAYIVGAWQPQFATTVDVGFAECYSVDPVTGIRTFVWTMNLSTSGTSASATVPLVEGVFVFKTTAGKPLKVYVMEAVYAADVRNIGVVPADGRDDMVDYILSDQNIFYGRTDAWPLAFMSFTSKENDVLRKNSLLPAV